MPKRTCPAFVAAGGFGWTLGLISQQTHLALDKTFEKLSIKIGHRKNNLPSCQGRDHIGST